MEYFTLCALNCFTSACNVIMSMNCFKISVSGSSACISLFIEFNPAIRSLANESANKNDPNASVEKHAEYFIAESVTRNFNNIANAYPYGCLQSNGNLIHYWQVENNSRYFMHYPIYVTEFYHIGIGKLNASTPESALMKSRKQIMAASNMYPSEAIITIAKVMILLNFSTSRWASM